MNTRRQVFFQYPQTDRDLCNKADLAAVSRIGTNFQYPHTDRDLCNQEFQQDALHLEKTFSILTRIETSATNALRNLPLRFPILSVSSDGSRPLQQWKNSMWFVCDNGFQYPHTDRDLCNLAHYWT